LFTGADLPGSHGLRRTTALLEQELSRFGVKTVLVDANDLVQVRQALSTPTRLLFVETMSNPLLRVADPRQLAELAQQSDCLLVVDTFATPVLVRPLEAVCNHPARR
jgi:cystathionine beta-lyase/cystathionine gamma-synthase